MKLRVVIVDDEALARARLRRLLGSERMWRSSPSARTASRRWKP